MAARSTLYWSAEAGGFFDSRLHPEDAIPADAVRIGRKRHADLMSDQARGATILRGPGGVPVAKFPPVPSLADRRAAAIAAVKREAGRRIEAAVPLWRQINDMLALSSVADPDHEAALGRRAWIDRVRAASAVLEATVAGLAAGELAGFDVSDDARWPA